MLISSLFILQQQKRYQQIKSSALIIQSYIRGWKVSLEEVSLIYLGLSGSSKRKMSLDSLCRGELLISCLPCKQSGRNNKYYGANAGPCDLVLAASFQGFLFKSFVLWAGSPWNIPCMISVCSCSLFVREAPSRLFHIGASPPMSPARPQHPQLSAF